MGVTKRKKGIDFQIIIRGMSIKFIKVCKHLKSTILLLLLIIIIIPLLAKLHNFVKPPGSFKLCGQKIKEHKV